MPRTRSLMWSELRLGVLTIIALFIGAMTVFLVTGSRGFSWQRYHLKTRFSNVPGLKSGSPVRLAGIEVGSVSEVQLQGDEVDVLFEVNKNVRDRITTSSVAKLGSVSLLGEGTVDINPAGGGTPIPEWGYVPHGRPPAMISDISETASQGLDEVTGLVRDMRSGRGTVGKLMTDDALYKDLQRFVAAAADVTAAIREGKGSAGRLVNDPSTVQALDGALKNLEKMTGRINAGEGSLGKLLTDDAFARSLTGATGNLETLTARLNRGEGTAGKLMTDATLFDRLNSVTDRLDQLAARLNEGQGTAGLLLKDKQLYENMNGTVSDLRALVGDIRKDPKKYLNVRISIF
jgi:phospholipid/cholesterol/gamma-HCH transport system substrate-binding protein